MKKLNQLLTVFAASAMLLSTANATPVTRNDVVGADTTLAASDTHVITTSGCASASACTLEEFANGGTMTVNGITLSNFSIDWTQGAYDSIAPADLLVYGLDNVISPFTGAFGIQGTNDFPFDIFGFDTGDMDFSFDLSVAAGMEMIGLGGVNQIFAGSIFSSFLTLEADNGSFLDFYDDDNTTPGLLTENFAGVSTLNVTAALSNFADDNGFLFYDGFQFAIETTNVPEPAPLLLMLIALGWLGYRRQSAK